MSISNLDLNEMTLNLNKKNFQLRINLNQVMNNRSLYSIYKALNRFHKKIFDKEKTWFNLF